MRRLLAISLLATTAAFGASFPKPAPDKAFAEFKIYDAEGHPWRTAREDWAGARQRVASDPAWADWVAKQRAEVDRWIATKRDRVEWAAGWSHDGISPVDGARLVWTEKIPREEVPYVMSVAGDKVDVTDLIFAWWVVTFRGRNVETMVHAAQLFRLTGDDRYAKWAAGQMDFYADNFAHWKTLPTAKSKLFWQTLTEGSNLVKFTETARLLGDYATPAQRAAWKEKLFNPEVALLNATHHDIHNIATWQRCSVAQVALLFNDGAMWKDAIDGNWGLRRQMAEGVTSDYLWYEQSLGYNSFVVGAVLTLFTSAGIQGRAAELADEMNIAENLMLSVTTLRFPDGKLPNPADSGAPGTAPNRELFASAYRVFPTPLGLTESAQRRDWETLLDPPPPSPRAPTLPAVTSRNLETTRMALLKSGPWQVFIHYGQLTRSHTQAEALNYSAYFGRTDVTHDTGTVGYGSPLHKGYYTRGANHNVPLVNGDGEEDMPQVGELVSYSENPSRVSVAQPHYRKDAHATRTLAIDGDTLIDTASIETTKGAQKLGLALHVQGKAKLPPAFAVAENFSAGRPEPFKRWRDVRQGTFRDRAEFDVDYGDGVVLHVAVAAPGEFTLFHGSTPDTPPKRRESFYLELAQPATTATFTTTFSPAK